MDRLIDAAFPLLGLVGLLLLLRPASGVQARPAAGRADLPPLRRVAASGASPRRRQPPAS